MTSEGRVAASYREIRKEYAWNPDVMCEDEPRVARVKEIIDTRLTPVDKTIILMYADLQSYRKLGALMRLSHMTVRREVLRIRRLILEEMKK